LSSGLLNHSVAAEGRSFVFKCPYLQLRGTEFCFSSIKTCMSWDLVTRLASKGSLLSHARVCLAEKDRRADKSLARPASRCILFDGENISFDASLLFIYMVVSLSLSLSIYIYIYIYM
jgi:hypothetical protein